jgi:hypothetical protein
MLLLSGRNIFSDAYLQTETSSERPHLYFSLTGNRTSHWPFSNSSLNNRVLFSHKMANYNSRWLNDFIIVYKMKIDRHFINFTNNHNFYSSIILSVFSHYIS